MKLGESVTEIERLIFAEEQGGAVGGIVFIVAPRNDGVNAVISTSLEEVSQLLRIGVDLADHIAAKKCIRHRFKQQENDFKLDDDNEPGPNLGGEY